MNDLTDLLERTAARTPVGPPPLDGLRAGASRRRRRRTLTWSSLSAAAVAAVVVGTTLAATHGSDVPSPVSSPTPPLVGTRLVGVGHAAIAVPANWGTNQSMCGTPRQDTVQIDDPSTALYCFASRPAGVDSVTLGHGGPELRMVTDKDIEIGGVPAVRRQTKCSVTSDGFPFCFGEVRFHDMWVRAESSTSAAEVDRLLSQVMILPDRVGVPSYESVPQVLTGSKYASVLRQLGLKATFRSATNPNYRPGQVFGVSPAPGTMVAQGSAVTVTVAK